MQRLLPLLALVLSCSSDTGPNLEEQVLGIWRISQVNGHTVPTVAESGDTVVAGYLRLKSFPDGSRTGSRVSYCVSDPNRELLGESLGWDNRKVGLLIFYPDHTGFAPIDTASVNGGTLHWHTKGAEPRLGTSIWDLIRISPDPDQDIPNPCM